MAKHWVDMGPFEFFSDGRFAGHRYRETIRPGFVGPEWQATQIDGDSWTYIFKQYPFGLDTRNQEGKIC